MAKIKLTRVELKHQKDALNRFLRYLPTLLLKKQQLQMEMRRVEVERGEKTSRLEAFERQVSEWAGLFCESTDPETIVSSAEIHTKSGNIAGVEIPLYEDTVFETKPYDLFLTPVWVDRGVEAVKGSVRLRAQISVLEEQHRLLGEELRTTTQRVNLFEKVMIPKTRENIRVIRIFLGDQQTAAVVRGKMAKSKLEAGALQ